MLEFKKDTVEGAKALWIELPSRPESDLNWKKELEEARESSKRIVWYFNLGLEDPYFPIEDEMRFNALSLSLQRFTKEVWPEFAEKTLALSIYRGSIPSFPIYFQMLAHKLPDEVPIWLLFSIEPHFSETKAVELISADGYEHFKIALRGKELPIDGYRWDERGVYTHFIDATVGAVYPEGPNRRFDQLLKRGAVKIVFEKFLTEQWDGLDRLLVLAESVTPQVNRMLQGFSAAGGEVELV